MVRQGYDEMCVPRGLVLLYSAYNYFVGLNFRDFCEFEAICENIFSANFVTSHHRLLLQCICEIFFNEIVKNSNLQKFRPAKYKRYTV